MTLQEYNNKRDFESTYEPFGSSQTSSEVLRFVVQHHIARREHYDFRLEFNGAFLSWAVPKGPSYNTKDKRLAVMVEEHPLEYRNFEGTIPKGEYGGGTVLIWDEGTWEPYMNVESGLDEGSLKFILHGRRLKGKWALVRMKTDDKQDNWLLIKEKDEFAHNDVGIEDFTTSIRTGRTLDEIEQGQQEKLAKNPFELCDVQLATLTKEIPKGDEWLYEMKYDGYRILAFIEGNSVRLITRNKNDYTHRFGVVASSLLDLAGSRAMVLDGEMVVTDENGRTDFGALQSYLNNPSKNLSYVVFDILALDGVDIRNKSLIERKEILEKLMQNTPKNLHYSRHIEGTGEESFKVACELGMEGIVGKKKDSVYSGARNNDWIKIKCEKRQEFVMGGYTHSNKRNSGVSSILLGFYDDNAFVYAGRAGTGISEAEGKRLEAEFKGILRDSPPFTNFPKLRANESVFFVEPELVAEVKFAEWTKENQLRQASYKGLRSDKNARDVRLEKTAPMEESIEGSVMDKGKFEIKGVKISSPDKVIFEAENITKLDVIRYYEQVANRMLPYLSHRVLSIVRCPKGISQSCFYKKHPGADNKGIVTIPIISSEGKSEEYFYIENETGLIYEAQMGTIEFHTWGSKAEAIENPDILVFDLDPDEGMDIEQVRIGVRDIKSILEELSLKSYLKTSGGKGYHVVVPLRPTATFEVINTFARKIAEVMEQKWPNRYTSNVRKAKRAGKIFIDWIRNGRGATSVAPYSLRARKGASVSMPLSWDELNTVAPDEISMSEALKRIHQKDPWHDFFTNNQVIR